MTLQALPSRIGFGTSLLWLALSGALGACKNAQGSTASGASAASAAPAAAAGKGLAITDTEVTVGQLHSATGTMAISETGSIQAERLAIDQINRAT